MKPVSLDFTSEPVNIKTKSNELGLLSQIQSLAFTFMCHCRRTIQVGITSSNMSAKAEE